VRLLQVLQHRRKPIRSEAAAGTLDLGWAGVDFMKLFRQ
jgi:hypothetical protein